MNAMMYFLWVLVIILVTNLKQSSGQVPVDVRHCCESGSALAETSDSCTNYTRPIPYIPFQQQILCASVLELCCIQRHRSVMCSKGVETATNNQECLTLPRLGGEYHKDCCVACYFGRTLRSLNDLSVCTLKTTDFPTPWHQAFASCCLSNVNTGESQSEAGRHDYRDLNGSHSANQDIDECSTYPQGQLCDHKCINTPQSYYCECNAGYRLLSDRKTCVAGTDRCGANNPCSQICLDTGDAIICNCNLGYELQNDKRTCTDIDECELEEDECDLATQLCVNTIGSYTCVKKQGLPDQNELHLPLQPCLHGYEYSPVTGSCKDIDECALGLHTCNSTTQFCSNTEGSYACLTKDVPNICPPGYKLHHLGTSCIDIDECAEGLGACDRDREFCFNLQGTYECQLKSKSTCPAGYKYNDVKQSCEDVDECAENLHDCHTSEETCRNIVGAYECDVKCEQGFRYSLAFRMCTDIDECLENLHDCEDDKEFCVNTLGTYECTSQPKSQCPAGYKPSGDDDECIDVDECEENLDSCDKDVETCVNDIGFYHCKRNSDSSQFNQCSDGHRPDPEDSTKCVDINECEEETHDCGQQNAICVNTIGSYQCRVIQCPAGYKMNFTLKACQDFNECEEKTDTCNKANEICVNNIGSYQCQPKDVDQTASCPSGYRPESKNSLKCIDINECEENLHDCDQQNPVCVNTDGSFVCRAVQCPYGYRMNITLKACQDVNECVERLHNCTDEREECVNLIGGFRCQQKIPECPKGHMYNITSRSCEDINECEMKIDTCNHTSEICLNTNGSFRCWLARCPPGYRVNITSRGCEDIDECNEHQHNCSSDQNCVNYRGGFSCMAPPTVPSCPQGYQYHSQRQACEDINECEENLHNCNLETQTCENKLGGFICQDNLQCGPGFRYSREKSACLDIDECIENIDTCREREQCVNSIGSFSCILQQIHCPNGYRINPQTRQCQDIDECAENLHNCHNPFETCYNIQGGYRCLSFDYRRQYVTSSTTTPTPLHLFGGSPSRTNTFTSDRYCPIGYKFNEEHRRCIDVNECQQNTHNCATSQRCDNTIGSFTCIRITACGTGYTLNAHTSQCEDDNECDLETHNCGPGYICRNTLGSFRCDIKTCPPGYRLASDGNCDAIQCGSGFRPDASGTCADYNECLTPNICRSDQQCINTVGSYYCRNVLNCGSGYETDPQNNQCVDIDECARRTHDCRHGQTCVNRPGGYSCQCDTGYKLNAHKECEDTDECTAYGKVCPQNSVCQNTPGSYTCRCEDGFRHGDSDKVCIDVDECQEYGSSICQQNCINTWGSYQCTCLPGYTQGPDKRTCIDVDECSIYKERGTDLCIGICVNEPGSFSCSCPSGYTLGADKRICQDIDECKKGNICRGPNQICLNTRGGYKCNEILCPPGYIKDTSHKNRCKRESTVCHKDDEVCINEPLTISHNYLTFVSNLTIPPTGYVNLFTMRGPPFQNVAVDFKLDLKNLRSPPGIPQVTRSNFKLQRTSFNQAAVSLIRSIQGPQEIELELFMKLFRGSSVGGVALAKIHVYVSEYDF